MTGRCEICGKENTHLKVFYDIHICDECAERFKKDVDEGGQFADNPTLDYAT